MNPYPFLHAFEQWFDWEVAQAMWRMRQHDLDRYGVCTKFKKNGWCMTFYRCTFDKTGRIRK